ncbi:hypothetical protein [Burkholderia multivorans]|uniref:hypothetical protein n=2 Tax=Burkholderia multivorans TaxID=87883 RepID=UPI0021C2548E|nr:hypothetical protein [Burkholderia multivorans]MDR8762555.1 hypothetical protein [Burkholderia multivorans]MDR8765123.1 hypothetical protein [Burkholderia multivorans]MDR8793249.1 hypothetical protein [Burkholderia multivorans]MDR8796241.1 hypothetical protein [Burkholderia multivorans]MDR8803356.1 hypothetical protein [Burkholderia multivorans]
MAASILPLALRYLDGLPVDSDLSLTLELEDLTSMPAQRIEEVIAEIPPGEMRGFFYGVLHMRNMIDACMGMPA